MALGTEAGKGMGRMGVTDEDGFYCENLVMLKTELPVMTPQLGIQDLTIRGSTAGQNARGPPRHSTQACFLVF